LQINFSCNSIDPATTGTLFAFFLFFQKISLHYININKNEKGITMGKLLMVSLIVFSQLFSQELKENDQSDNGWSIYGGMASMGAGAGIEDLQDYDGRDYSRNTAFEFGVIKAVSHEIDIGIGFSKRGWSEGIDTWKTYDEDWSASAFELWGTYDLFNLENDISFWIGSSYAILSTIEVEVEDDGDDYSQEFDIANDFSVMFGVTLPAGSDGNTFKVGYQSSLGEVEITDDDHRPFYFESSGPKFNKFFVNFIYSL